jgi:hypothetical protein
MGILEKSTVPTVNPKISIIRLFHKYEPEGFDYDVISTLMDRLIMFYRPGKAIPFSILSLADRHKAAIAVVKEFIHYFPSDIMRSYLLNAMLSYYFYEQESLQWMLVNVIGNEIKDIPDGSPIHECIRRRMWDRDRLSATMIVQKTENKHKVWKPEYQRAESMETPTSLAMFQASTFFTWRNLLRELGVDLESFCTRELEEVPLMKAGWDLEGLLSLFEYTGEGSGVECANSRVCERCGDKERWSWWHIYRLTVDLPFRRRLRELRNGWAGSTLTENQNRLGEIEDEKVVDEIAVDHWEIDGRVWPYRMVCSDGCSDGICVAWLYENDGTDEPYLPPFQPEPEEIDDTEYPSYGMPGAFGD